MGEMVRRLETEVAELKRLRAEDAKANEKVAGIFAAQEQSWFTERKKFKLQIRALLAQFQATEGKKEEEIARLSSDLEERDRTIQSREEELEALQSEKQKTLEENLKLAEERRVELESEIKAEAEKHSSELLEQKTAFVELVSTHSQLEAEMGRLARRSEEIKAELDEAVEQKRAADAAAAKLYEEAERVRRDAEQKDKVLSAMLRRSKVDSAEKQVLLKEVKAMKARRKQAEMEAERWRVVAESRRRGRGSRVGQYSIEPECSRDRRRGESAAHGRRETLCSRIRLLEYLQDADCREERGCGSSDDDDDDDGDKDEDDDVAITEEHLRGIVDGENEELIMTDIRQLQEWIQTETERYAAAIEQRHSAEIEAFAEQMRLKDEKVEVLRWQFLTAELEMKQLQSHVEGLDGNLSRIREENIRLETSLLEREKELKSAKDRFALHMLHCRKTCLKRRSKVIKEQEGQVLLVKDLLKTEKSGIPSRDVEVHGNGNVHEYLSPELKHVNSYSQCNQQDARGGIIEGDVQVCEDEIEEEKEVVMDRGNIQSQNKLQQQDSAGSGTKFSDLGAQHSVNKESTWKMDVQAIGVSYKIKRLKQQLTVLEKLAGKDWRQISADRSDEKGRKTNEKKRQPSKGFPLLISLLNKQVTRYESLEEKTNDLCTRMHESQQDRKGKDPDGVGAKEEAGKLEHFLEETFQLQRYLVATGQKMMDIQSRITCSFIGCDGEFEDCPGVNMGQFADIVRSLFRDVQRGLEVRIARIIGNVEGTLALEGILHMRI